MTKVIKKNTGINNFLLFCPFPFAQEELSAQAIIETNLGQEERAVQTFRNPILSPRADPWVLKTEDTYYYTQTSGNRLELWETDKMQELKSASKLIVWTPPKGKQYSHHIWAPELHYLDGKWYLYFAATHGENPESIDQNRRMFVLENISDGPMNTAWEFKGKVSDNVNRWAIDGTVFKKGGNAILYGPVRELKIKKIIQENSNSILQ